MQDIENEAKITPVSFRERWDVLRPLLLKKKSVIAFRAECSVRRVNNAIAMQISSPDLLQPIMDAMEEVAREELEKIQL